MSATPGREAISGSYNSLPIPLQALQGGKLYWLISGSAGFWGRMGKWQEVFWDGECGHRAFPGAGGREQVVRLDPTLVPDPVPWAAPYPVPTDSF